MALSGLIENMHDDLELSIQQVNHLAYLNISLQDFQSRFCFLEDNVFFNTCCFDCILFISNNILTHQILEGKDPFLLSLVNLDNYEMYYHVKCLLKIHLELQNSSPSSEKLIAIVRYIQNISSPQKPSFDCKCSVYEVLSIITKSSMIGDRANYQYCVKHDINEDITSPIIFHNTMRPFKIYGDVSIVGTVNDPKMILVETNGRMKTGERPPLFVIDDNSRKMKLKFLLLADYEKNHMVVCYKNKDSWELYDNNNNDLLPFDIDYDMLKYNVILAGYNL